MSIASTSNGTSPPSPTLYVKNIPSKIKKPELRRQLYTLFSAYGRVLDVVATRAPSMRGQAFIVYESVSTSSAAKRALGGFSFYGQELNIDYSNGAKSKALLRRELGDEAVMEADLERSRTTLSKRVEGKRPLFPNQSQEDEEEEDRSKRIKLENPAVVNAKNIPNTIEQSVLQTLFASRPGFVDLTPHQHNDDTWTATITFDTREHAQAASTALHGVQLDPVYTLDLTVS